MVCVCCYNRRQGNAVKGLWALLDNIYDCVYLALQVFLSLIY
jgi:hypothetical protein